MRLIDADKLLNIIREEQKQDRPDDFKLYNIRRIVEDMESAYNIDAVVEELEEASFYDTYLSEETKVIDRDKAIEIVRNGGVKNG